MWFQALTLTAFLHCHAAQTRTGAGSARQAGFQRRLDESQRSGFQDQEDEDGRTHLAHKAEHAVDVETGAIIAITVQGADAGDTETIERTVEEAATSSSTKSEPRWITSGSLVWRK